MRCSNERCELYGQDITARNREDDGSLSPRATCPVCGEVLVGQCAMHVILDTDNGPLVIRVADDASCTICGKRITVESFRGASGPICLGDPEDPIFTCVDHFLHPDSDEHGRNMDKLANHVAAKWA